MPVDRLPDPFDFESIRLTALTRISPLCACELCETARFNPVGTDASIGPLKHRPFPRGQPRKREDEPAPSPITVCDTCYSRVGKGLPHICTTPKKRQNLTNALGSDSRGHEILAAEVLRSKGAAAPEDPLIRLATRGPNQLPVINPVHRGATGAGIR
jgi:hypothetical protein